jgi:hypothetical protein
LKTKPDRKLVPATSVEVQETQAVSDRLEDVKAQSSTEPQDSQVTSNRVDMLAVWSDDPEDNRETLGLVRLDNNEEVVIPFTTDGIQASIHYCDEPEIRAYVRCNGQGCTLCRIGRERDERFLLPVYMPKTQAIGVLAISPSSRPGALRPQIMPILKSGRRVAVFIRRPDRAVHRVTCVDLTDEMDDGAEIIAEFTRRWDSGQVNLASVYPRQDDDLLAELPGIAAMLKFKGLTK